MPEYQLYGYRISSELELPVPAMVEVPAGGHRDLQVCTVREGGVLRPRQRTSLRSSEGRTVGWLGAVAHGTVFNYQDQAEFFFSAGKIHVANFSLDGADLVSLLISQVIPMALSAKSGLIIHASAAVCAGQAFAFVGLEGAGKSTLAASLWQRGFEIISDDSVRIEISGGVALAHAGSPEIRVFQKVLQELSVDVSGLAMSKAFLKERLPLASIAGPARPLAGLFCLNPTKGSVTPSVNALAAPRALPFLLRGLFRCDLESTAAKENEFKGVLDLLERVPAYLLTYNHDWNQRETLLKEILAVIDK